MTVLHPAHTRGGSGGLWTLWSAPSRRSPPLFLAIAFRPSRVGPHRRRRPESGDALAPPPATDTPVFGGQASSCILNILHVRTAGFEITQTSEGSENTARARLRQQPLHEAHKLRAVTAFCPLGGLRRARAWWVSGAA